MGAVKAAVTQSYPVLKVTESQKGFLLNYFQSQIAVGYRLHVLQSQPSLCDVTLM